MSEREALRKYLQQQGEHPTDEDLDRIIERETGGIVWERDYDYIPGIGEVLRPTWKSATKGDDQRS